MVITMKKLLPMFVSLFLLYNFNGCGECSADMRQPYDVNKAVSEYNEFIEKTLPETAGFLLGGGIDVEGRDIACGSYGRFGVYGSHAIESISVRKISRKEKEETLIFIVLKQECKKQNSLVFRLN